MARNNFKLISINLNNVTEPSPTELAAEEREEMRPGFLIPFNKKFDLKKIPDIIGRDEEIKSVMSALAVDSNPNLVLLGFPGTGKTALGLVIAKGLAEGTLDPCIIANYTGETEVEVLYLDAKKLKAAGGKAAAQLDAIEEYAKRFPCIIFVDEAHQIGKKELGDSSSLLELMKPMLNEPYSHFIFATTVEEYETSLKTVVAGNRRWCVVSVPETDRMLSKLILKQHRETLLGRERYQKLPFPVIIPDAAINLIVEYAEKYLNPTEVGYNPSRPIKLLERALALIVAEAATVKMTLHLIHNNLLKVFNDYLKVLADKDEASIRDSQVFMEENIRKYLEEMKKALAPGRGELTEEHVYAALSKLTGMPSLSFQKLDAKFLESLPGDLKKRVVGQDNVCDQVALLAKRARLGLGDPKRPLMAMLFAGPTGVGKTELAKALAFFLYGSEKAMVVINGPEFAEKWKLSGLIGSAAGYVGYGDKTKFDEVKDKNGRCVVLFDEFEKMAKEAQDILLRILDEGEIEDARHQRINFREAAVIFTSNLGSKDLIHLNVEESTEDFMELLRYRKETLTLLEGMAEELEGKSRSLQSKFEDGTASGSFKQAEKLSGEASLVRQFLAKHADDLQKGIFPREGFPSRAVGAFLEGRGTGDAERKEIFEKGGSLKYERKIKQIREETTRFLVSQKEGMEQKATLLPAGEEKAALENKVKQIKEFMDEGFIRAGVYATVMFDEKTFPETVEKLRDAEEKEKEYAKKRADALLMETKKDEIIKRNQESIEKTFAANYKPEFLGRLKMGGIFAFNQINRKMALAIIRIKAEKFMEEEKRLYNVEIGIADEVYDWILASVSDLAAMGGRGIEKTFNAVIKDALGVEYLQAGTRSSARVDITLKEEKVKIEVKPLEQPDVTKLVLREGEAGEILKHFHEQALAILAVYSKKHKVSLENIQALLELKKIADRGAPLTFSPNEFMRASHLTGVLQEFKNTPVQPALKDHFARHIADKAGNDFALSAFEVLKGLVLLAAKTLFNHILLEQCKNARDDFDALSAREDGGNGLIAKVTDADAAQNFEIAWQVAEDRINARITFPGKLTDREIRLLKFYAERATSDPMAAQGVKEEALKQGLNLNVALLQGLGKLKGMVGPEVKIGYHVEEGKISFWASIPRLKTAAPGGEAPTAGARPKEKIKLPAFDPAKKDADGYYPEFLKKLDAACQEMAPEEIPGRPEIIPVVEEIKKQFEIAITLADANEVDILEPYVADVIDSVLTAGDARIRKSPVFAAIVRAALEPFGQAFSFLKEASLLLDRRRFVSGIKERGAGLDLSDQDTGAAAALFEKLRAGGGMDFEKMTEKDFAALLQNTNLLAKVSEDAYLSRLLGLKGVAVTAGRGEEGEITFAVSAGRYSGELKVKVQETGLPEEEVRAKEEWLFDRAAGLDIPLESAADGADLLKQIEGMIREINDHPMKGRLAEKLLSYPAIKGSPLDILQTAIRENRGEKKVEAAAGPGEPLSFSGTVLEVKTLLAKIYLNASARSEAERPYTEEALLDEARSLLANGDPALANAFRRYLIKSFSGYGNNLTRKLKIPVRKVPDAGEALAPVLGQNFSVFKDPLQSKFWSEVVLGLAKQKETSGRIDARFLISLLNKGAADKDFRNLVLLPVLSAIIEMEKSYYTDFDAALLVLESIINFAGSFSLKSERGEEAVNLLLKWMGGENELIREIENKVPALKGLSTLPNIFAIYTGGKVSGAIDTADFLSKNPEAFKKILQLFAEAFKGKAEEFKFLQNGPTGDKTLPAVLNNKQFFRDAGGCIVLMAVRETKEARTLYVSVTGRSKYGEWRFEAPLNLGIVNK